MLANIPEKRYFLHVKSALHARDFVADLTTRGRYSFTSADVKAALGGTHKAALHAVGRLAQQGLIASPAQGFYVIVPPEYRSLGCLPADQFIPDLMAHLDLRYYVSLLSAAQYFGAAHQRPQAFQVFLERNRRPIECGLVRVAFNARHRLAEVPVQTFNTLRGTLLVSSPEATAFDLIGYADRVGGLGQVATILSELADRLDAEKLAAVAPTAPVAWAQRLGYLLDRLDFSEKAFALKTYVRAHAKQSTALAPQSPRGTAPRDPSWKLYVNARVESQL